MKKSELDRKDFIFSTTATNTDSSNSEEFFVEVFDYNPELSCKGNPRLTIKNFDELIEFFEKID